MDTPPLSSPDRGYFQRNRIIDKGHDTPLDDLESVFRAGAGLHQTPIQDPGKLDKWEWAVLSQIRQERNERGKHTVQMPSLYCMINHKRKDHYLV